jgi:hypothetical protein
LTGIKLAFPKLITFEYMKFMCIFYRDFLEAYERPKGESETGENDDLSQEGEHHFWTPSCNTARAKVPEPEFLNFLGAKESIQRNLFRQPGGPVRQPYFYSVPIAPIACLRIPALIMV